jgi:hypothetical protein
LDLYEIALMGWLNAARNQRMELIVSGKGNDASPVKTCWEAMRG